MKKITVFFITFWLVFSMTACTLSQAKTETMDTGEQVSEIASQVSAAVSTQSAGAAAAAAQDSSTTSSEAASASTSAGSVAAALAENQDSHDDEDDYVWDSANVVQIVLNGDVITADGQSVSVAGSTATITSAGTYSLSGSLSDGQIIVNSPDDKVVRLILNGVDLHSSTSAPIYVVEAEETIIILADGTENYVSDAASYVFADPAEAEPNAAIFSKSDLTIYGQGALTVTGNYNDGISSKDGLIIASGTLTVNAVDDGLCGKDYIVMRDGNLTVTAAQGDGLKSDNEEDAARGYILIEAGVIQITSAGDAIAAQTDVLIAGGEITLTSGGGSNGRVSDTTSAKGIKGVASVAIDGGTLTINSADDALHSNASLVINAGTFVIASGDDGMHTDATLEINGGDIQITESYEGLESAVITINAGNIHIHASDDGINISGGMDSSGMGQGGMRTGGRGAQDTFSYSGSYYLYIHGGYIYVDANGDGLDVNGAIEMSGGVVLVNGPTQQMNGALDYDAGFLMSGGFLVTAGSSGMAMAPGSSSSQYSLLMNLTGTFKAGTLIHIQSSDGEDVLTFAPSKQYQSITFSSPTLVKGATYQVYSGGSSSGTETGGLYQGGTYTPGEEYAKFTVSNVVTTVGSASRGRP
jgi:hypothetical protein